MAYHLQAQLEAEGARNESVSELRLVFEMDSVLDRKVGTFEMELQLDHSVDIGLEKNQTAAQRWSYGKQM
ncbi:hypothetical protein E4U14_004027 [Claviceps sp. LM454 group G7]|nr:hypothetical protein E4U14_004027 [Claviceps sp. LM454 group G7]